MSARRKRRIQQGLPEAWGIELHTECSGLFFYSYRRLRVERTGRRASVREFTFLLEYDADRFLVTKPRQMVRQRGRSLPVEECDEVWGKIAALRDGLEDHYLCLDDTDPQHLDPSQVDGVPVTILTGEEGPACLTLREGREREGQRAQRVPIERFRQPSCQVEARHRRQTPLTAIVEMIDPGLRATRPFTYRRSRVLEDLTGEFLRLKALDFLNLREFERRFVEALGWLADPDAVPVLTGELFVSDPQVRLEALDALATIGDGAARSDVELLCYDDDPSVRDRAREALERLRVLR